MEPEMEKEDNKRCKNCAHVFRGGHSFYCFRFPPTLVGSRRTYWGLGSIEKTWAWPATYENMWCGEFKRKATP